MSSKNISRRTIAFFFLLALMFSLLNISKVFFVPHCMAFDLNDDANHTFINLQQWHRVLSDGEWPMMNVYNNFGTPLIGDVITYPLSPLSITYALLPGPVAMTINRAGIGFLTLFLLFIFYHRRFPKGMSLGLGVCTFYAPGFLWHSAHHHFQLSLLLLTGFFLLQEKFTKTMSIAAYIGICALSLLMFMSISLNVVMILCILIFGYQVFLSGSVNEKSLWIVVSGILCGMVAVFPDILLFGEATFRSIRRLAEYPVGSLNGPNKIFWTPVVAAAVYSIALFRERRNREGGVVLWLGVIPFIIVLLSKALPFLWKQIPLLGATDVMRLTWGASIFLMIGAGGLLLRWLQLSRGWRTEVFVCLLALGADAFYLPFAPDWNLWGKVILALVWVLVGSAIVCWIMLAEIKEDRIREIRMARRIVVFVSGAVVMAYLYYGFFAVLGFAYPKICHVRGLPAFSSEGSEKSLLSQALLLIPKNSRVAYDVNSIQGLDLRGAGQGLFGSGARSTIMTNADFAVGLFNKGLVQFDNYTGDYHFCRPWKAKELQGLGISYVVGKSDQSLVDKGWKQIAGEKGLFVYQNPLPTGVVFLKDGEKISPVSFVVEGNGLNVQLPSNRQAQEQLVISLLRIPGWQAWIDGHESLFLEGENNFLILSVSPGDHFVRVRYVPFPWGTILLSFLIALIIPCLVVKVFFYGK